VSRPIPFSFEEHDLDGARAAIARNYFPTSLDLLSARSPYEFRFDGHVDGPLAVGYAWYTSAMRIGMGETGGVYVNFPVKGTMLAEHRHREVDVSPERAAVFQPTGPVRMTTSDDYASYAVKIETRALDEAVEALVGHPVAGELELGPDLDLKKGPGRGWARLVRLLATESGPDGLAADSRVSAPLREAVVHGLLRVAEHRYREALDAPIRSFAPAAVRRVVDAVQADPGHPFTLTEMAATAMVSVRTLQEAFRRHLGVSPREYLRRVRLDRAHRELLAADPAAMTVGRVAQRWGFAHTGRFAAAYRARYGLAPSDTLRGRAIG
jgi:AraC-like DNA-binding protein